MKYVFAGLALGCVLVLAFLITRPGAAPSHRSETPPPSGGATAVTVSPATSTHTSTPSMASASTSAEADESAPTLPPSATIFAHPTQPAYTSGQGFAPDVQRLLDLSTLQIGLEKYHLAKGAYPSQLADLFPAFAPRAGGRQLTTPPLDPVTKQPYSYQVTQGGQDYQLTAILDSGKPYSVTHPAR